MQPKQITTAVLTNDANGICVDQTTAGAADLNINGADATGGVATAAEAQIISIEGAGNSSGITLTVYGDDSDGNATTEIITGPNAGTVTSAQYFKTVTKITASGAVTGDVEIGWLAASGMATRTIPTNYWQSPFSLTLDFHEPVTGATVTCQYSVDDPLGTDFVPFQETTSWNDVTGFDALTADGSANLAFSVRAIRFIQTIGTTTATARFTAIQGWSH